MVINIGGFDVNNFGDLLFPFIIDHFVNQEVVHFSPTGGSTKWDDACETKSFYLLDEYAKNASSIILGGGHIVSGEPTNIEEYSKINNLKKIVYPSFWIYPTIIANKYKIPIIWNSLGVQNLNKSEEYRALSHAVFENIDYLSVRDSFSSNVINSLGGNCILLPDTAINIKKVFPRLTLEQTYLDFLIENKISNRKTAIFHLKERYIDCEIEEVYSIISKISKEYNVLPILIPFGQCHGDDILLERTKHLNSNFLYILEKYSIKLVLSLLANSEFLCGSSLHAHICAQSYNVKSIIIANENAIRFKKFSGFLQFYKNGDSLTDSWKNISGMLPKIMQNNNSNQDHNRDYFMTHWEKINSISRDKRYIRKRLMDIGEFKLAREIIDFYK